MNSVHEELTEQSTADKTQVILEAIAKVEQKVDRMSELQNVAVEVKAIRALINKQESRWTALWRGLTQFMSLLKD